MKTPCETIVWRILPVIRREFTKNLLEHHGYNQRRIATRLGISDAAVSRYIAGTRGNIVISDNKILKEIATSSRKIANGNKKTVIQETCRICNLLKSSSFLEGISRACK